MADIPMLAGWDQSLSSLPQLGQNLRDIFNPNYNIQQLFKAAIAKDPSILQTMANTPNSANVLQNLGFGNAISSSVGSIGVDPATQLSRAADTNALNALQTNPDLAKTNASVKLTGQTPATLSLEASRARVQNATESSQISQAGSQAQIAQNQVKITAKAADDAMREMGDNAAALAKFPSLAGIDINQVAQKIVSGQPLDPILVQRINMDPAASQALQQFQAALLQRMEMSNRMSVAQITSNREYAGLALQYLGGQQAQMRQQLATYAQIVHDQAPTLTDRVLASAPPKQGEDPALYNQAVAKIQAYDEARKNLQADSPTMKALAALDDKTLGIAQAIGTVTIPGVTSKDASKVNGKGATEGNVAGTRVSATTRGATPVDIETIANNIKMGNATIQDLNAALKSGQINQSQYNAIKKLVTPYNPNPSPYPSDTIPMNKMTRAQIFDPNIP